MQTRSPILTTLQSTLARASAACAGVLAWTSAQAHDGHGMLGTHWHASDALLWLAALVAAGLALAWHRGGRK